MTGNRPSEKAKESGTLVLELLDSLQVIRDSLRSLELGSAHAIMPLSGQLRALLLESRKDSHPLLLEVMRLSDYTSAFYVMPGVDDPASRPPLMSEPISQLGGPPFTLHRELPGQQLVTLEQSLTWKVLGHEGRTYSLSDIIRHYANRAGGAHFAKRLAEPFASLLTGVNPMSLQMAPVMRTGFLSMMRQFGHIVLQLGVDLVRRLCDFDVLMHVEVTGLASRLQLLNLSHPWSPMAVQISVQPFAGVVVELRGIDGEMYEVSVPGEVLDRNSLLALRVRHGEDLSTELSLELNDGVLQRSVTAGWPIFISNDFANYNVVVGDPAAEAADVKIHFGQLCLWRYVSPGESRRMYAAFYDHAAPSAPKGYPFLRLSAGVVGSSEVGVSDSLEFSTEIPQIFLAGAIGDTLVEIEGTE